MWQETIRRGVAGLMDSVIVHINIFAVQLLNQIWCCLFPTPIYFLGSIPYILVNFDPARKLPTLFLYLG